MSKFVLVTGAAGGIGKALCQGFTNQGYKVIAVDVAVDEANNVDCHEYLPVDLSSLFEEQNRQEFKIRCNKITGGNLVALINNAAIQVLGSVRELSLKEWQRTLDINLSIPFLLTQLFADVLSTQENGVVVNIGSIHSRLTKKSFSAYSVSKAGLNGLTRALSLDLAPEIRVNSIDPAATATEMLLDGFKGNEEGLSRLGQYHPLERIAEPKEIADLACFLASERARFINGACISVDGGISNVLHDPA